MSSSPPEAPLKRLLAHTSDHAGRVRLGVLYSVLNKLFDLAPPLLIGAAVAIVADREDSFVAKLGIEDPAEQFTWLAVVTAVIWIAESGFEFLQKIIWRNLAQTVQHELRLDAYGHVQQLELAFFEDENSGELMSVMNDDVNQLERFLNGGANSMVQLATTVLAVGAIFFWLSPAVAWVAFLPMPFIIWGSILYQRKLQARYVTVRQSVGALNADLAGNLGGIATIKSYARETAEAKRIEGRSDAYRTSNRAAITLSSAFSPLIRMFILAGFTATLLVGGKLALSGELDVGSFSVLVFMTQRLLRPRRPVRRSAPTRAARRSRSARRVLRVDRARPPRRRRAPRSCRHCGSSTGGGR